MDIYFVDGICFPTNNNLPFFKGFSNLKIKFCELIEFLLQLLPPVYPTAVAPAQPISGPSTISILRLPPPAGPWTHRTLQSLFQATAPLAQTDLRPRVTETSIGRTQRPRVSTEAPP